MKDKTFVKKTREFSKNLHIEFIKKLLVFEKLDSTNGTAKDLARAGAEEGTIIIAQKQSRGRGRFDRMWQSPEGGVYLSLILRPHVSTQNASLLPFIAALAVAKTIDSYGLYPTIKWPNDVRVNRKKIAGILLESEMDSQTISYVVVGIGVNLNVDIKDLSEDIRSKSTSISNEIGRLIDYFEFLTTLLVQFEEYYKLLFESNYGQIINEWKKQSDTIGKKIQIETASEIIEGIACGIDEAGFLMVRTNDGLIKKIASGDCVYFDELQHA